MRGLDTSLRQVWPAIVFGALLLIAYLQADGLMHLVGAAVGVPPAAPTLQASVSLPSSPTADSILRRNPFDSDTGPLGRYGPTVPSPSATASAADDPMTAPTCEFGYVTLITTAADPNWSFAAIEQKGGDSVLRRAGGAVDGHTVQYVAWDRVWLSNESGLCQLKLGDKPKVKKRPRPSRRAKRRRRRRSTRVPKNIASKIHRRSATEYDVERAAVDEILEDQFRLFRSTRVRPVKDGDQLTGMRLSRVRRGTLLYTLGLRNGDVVQSISGFPLTDPQKALQAYGRLRTADHLALSLTRKGNPVTIDVNIR